MKNKQKTASRRIVKNRDEYMMSCLITTILDIDEDLREDIYKVYSSIDVLMIGGLTDFQKSKVTEQAKKEIKSLLYKVGRKMQENIDGLHTDRKYLNQRKAVE